MNTYKQLSADELEAHLSEYMIEKWSYSSVSAFTRNPKAFEMRYIYHTYGKKSATTIAGEAYHECLSQYFKEGYDITKIKSIGFSYIDKVKRGSWKLSKTLPTFEQAVTEANKILNKLIDNFFKEKQIYDDNINKIISIEGGYTEWVSINGVEIPLPLRAVIDLAYFSKDGQVILCDHKSKKAYQDDEERVLFFGKQAMTYVLAFEAATGLKVDEFHFVENKYSTNKDGSPQLKLSIFEIGDNERKLYEAFLYEAVKPMIEAVNNPDYVYVINDRDNLSDMAELYDFWCKTLIGDIGEFELTPKQRAKIERRTKKIRDVNAVLTPKIIDNFQKCAAQFITYDYKNTNMTRAEIIEHKLRTFGIISEVRHTFEGYSSDSFLLEVGAGSQIKSVKRYDLDLAVALSVENVIISDKATRYDGKSYLKIEASKDRTQTLNFDPSKLIGKKIPIGIDNMGNNIIWDLESPATPHTLICGGSGSGKSVCIRSTIEYAIMSGVKDVVILDPKDEFGKYDGVAKRYNSIESIEIKMRELVELMERRVKSKETSKILLVFDEFNNAISQSTPQKKLAIREDVQDGWYALKKGESEQRPKYKTVVTGYKKTLAENMQILLEKGRSCGFNLLVATQRASTQVLKGDAKVNFQTRICFKVPSVVDSKVVLDESGAEKLQGFGDGLICAPQYSEAIRFQGYFKE